MNRLSRRNCFALAGGAVMGVGLHPRPMFAMMNDLPAHWAFGDVRVTKVLEVAQPFDAARAYPGESLEAFTQHADWLPPWFYDPSAQAIILSFHSYLVQTRHLTMIVDTCWGEDTPQRQRQVHGKWLENLAATGVRPDDVDLVTCTHFHADHVGWNTRLQNGRWVPTFPRARHLFSRVELEALEAGIEAGKSSSSIYERSILPILEAGQVIRLDGDHEVTDGVRIVPSPGHSPGHQHIEIDSRGERAVLSGDILHNPIEVRHPEWIKVFDEDKQAAYEQRLRFLDMHTDVDVTVLAAHFAGPTAGHIRSRSDGLVFRPFLGR